ncbi:MAG: hypothetical protein ACRCX2_33665 [Paraclostridium sp.]
MKRDIELNRVKKREKIVMHYTDGSTEEYDTGVLFSLEKAINEDGEVVNRIVGKHCNTKEYIREFNFALAQIVMAMLENEEKTEEFYNE